MIEILMTILVLLILFLLPALLVYLTRISSFLKSVGAITLCYAAGFLLALLPVPYDKGLTETVASVLVALAIPLILFSFDVRSVRKLARKTIIAFLLMMLSVISVSVIAFFVSRTQVEDAPVLSGMAAGLYIGGTPNLFAIGKALLGADSTAINLANISDSLIGGIYFLLLVSVMPKVYRRLLPQYEEKKARAAQEIDRSVKKAADEPFNEEVFCEDAADLDLHKAADAYVREADPEYDYSVLPKKAKGILRLAGVCLLAAACLGTGVLLEILINGNMDGSLYIMITVSILGLLLSFIRPVRETPGTYPVGQYLILIFSLGLAMSLDLNRMAASLVPTLLYFCAIQFGSLLLHFLLCRLARIDGGTAIITGTAGVYGPPFVAPVAKAYGQRSLIIPGVICGTFGLISGNLIGIGLGSLLIRLL